MKKWVAAVLVSAFVFGGTTLVQKPVEPVSGEVAKNAIGNVRVISETAMSVINNLRVSQDTAMSVINNLKSRHDTAMSVINNLRTTTNA